MSENKDQGDALPPEHTYTYADILEAEERGVLGEKTRREQEEARKGWDEQCQAEAWHKELLCAVKSSPALQSCCVMQWDEGLIFDKPTYIHDKEALDQIPSYALLHQGGTVHAIGLMEPVEVKGRSPADTRRALEDLLEASGLPLNKGTAIGISKPTVPITIPDDGQTLKFYASIVHLPYGEDELQALKEKGKEKTGEEKTGEEAAPKKEATRQDPAAHLKLYRVRCRGMQEVLPHQPEAYGDAYVVAAHPTAAYEKLRRFLDKNIHGVSGTDKELISVELIAENSLYSATGYCLHLDINKEE